MDKLFKDRVSTNWEKSDISLVNYQNYLGRKVDKFELTIMDLLYISNFKGGNATINEEEEILNIKLKRYSSILKQIDNTFKKQTLAQITNADFEKLYDCINRILKLCHLEETKIDGFKSSFLSALLHSYFPDLIPILDRRLLINLELVQSTDLLKSRQINKIENFYHILITKIREISQSENKKIRAIDKEYFTKKLPDWAT